MKDDNIEDKARGQQSSRFETDPSTVVEVGVHETEDVARTAGRGFLLITGAKVWFMVMGAAISIGLPRVMGAEQFGVYSVVVNAMSLLNMVLVTGSVQAVSKLVSEDPKRARSVLTQALKLQCLIGLPVALLYTLGADSIAGWFSDPTLGPLLRISGGVLFAYAFYAVFVGVLNGIKAFASQALLDVSFATLKAAFILGLVLAGFGVMGAVSGFVAAAILITAASALLVTRTRLGLRSVHAETDGDLSKEREGMKKLALYLGLIMVYTFGINGVLRADLFMLKSLMERASSLAFDIDHTVGVYAAMQNLSRIPYQAVIAVTFVVFPLISKATFESDESATRSYIRSTLRYSFLMLSLLGALLSGNAHDTVLVLFGEHYVSGVFPLITLSLATVAFALFFIATTVITGAGRPLASVGLAFFTLTCTVVFDAAAIHTTLSPTIDVPSILLAASSATALAMVLGCVASIAYLFARFRAGLPVATFARILIASVVVFGLSMLISVPSDVGVVIRLLFICGKGLLGVAVFLGLLVASGEFTAEDRARVMRVVRPSPTP